MPVPENIADTIKGRVEMENLEKALRLIQEADALCKGENLTDDSGNDFWKTTNGARWAIQRRLLVLYSDAYKATREVKFDASPR